MASSKILYEIFHLRYVHPFSFCIIEHRQFLSTHCSQKNSNEYVSDTAKVPSRHA